MQSWARRWTQKNRWWWIGLVLVAVVGTLAIYRYYRPSPLRTYRLFVKAVNAGDFDAQYALFLPDGCVGEPPTLPKEEFRQLLRAMRPPFPSGIVLSTRPFLVDYPPSPRTTGGIAVAKVLRRGDGPPATGPGPDYFHIQIQRTKSGYGVCPYSTYKNYFDTAYGPEAANRFEHLYHQMAYRRGLFKLKGSD